MCAGCGLGDGQIAPVYAKVVVRVTFVEERNGVNTFRLKDSSGPLAAFWVSLGAFWVSLGASGWPWELPVYESCMNSAWICHVYCMDSAWVQLGVRTDYIYMGSHGLSKLHACIVHGLCVEYEWIAHAVCMGHVDSTQIRYRF